MSGVLRYTSREVMPGVYHILDPLGVHLTLVLGGERALLFDTGYGALDLPAYLQTLTNLPLTVLLSHGHHDHALGAWQFEETYLHPDDLPVFEAYTGALERERVLARAGLTTEQERAFREAVVPKPLPLRARPIDLGGLCALPVHAPGHTPGSTALLLKEKNLLLLGDCWNPQTWVFFPEALDVLLYVKTMRSLMELPFETALAPHFDRPLSRAFLKTYTEGLTEEAIEGALPFTVPGHENIPTLAFEPVPGYPLIFRKP